MATNTQTPRHKLTIIEGDLILELASVITQTGGGGDMESATYDPQGIEGDAFDMANMTEAADAKVMTAAERSAITALGTASTREADQDLRTTDNVEFAEVTADTVNLHTAAFDTANGGPTALGEVAWDSTDGTLDLMAEDGVKVALGEDGLIRVRNTSGSTIPKGAPLVYLGTNGASTRLNVGPWIGSNVADVRIFLGFAAGAMASNMDGYATWFGKIKGITTDGGAENWDDGDILYCVPGVSSTLTNIKPTSGDYVTAAVVINAGSGTSGSLFVRPTFETASSGADQSLNTTDSPTFQSLTLNNGLSASELLVYGSDDGAGNFTRTSFTHSATGDLTIQTEAGGTGTAGDITLNPQGADGNGGKVVIDGDSFTAALQINNQGFIQFGTSSTYQIAMNAPSSSYIKSWLKPFEVFGTAGYVLHVDCATSGFVGIGTRNPARQLHVSDAMRLEPTTEPASPSAGDLYFDSSTNKLRCYDGSTWNDLF